MFQFNVTGVLLRRSNENRGKHGRTCKKKTVYLLRISITEGCGEKTVYLLRASITEDARRRQYTCLHSNLRLSVFRTVSSWFSVLYSLLCCLVKLVQAMCPLSKSWHQYVAILNSPFYSFVHHSHILPHFALFVAIIPPLPLKTQSNTVDLS